MLLLPIMIAAVVACDTSKNTGAPSGNQPTATTGAASSNGAQPYANSPEGKPKGYGNPVPDPQEATEIKPAGQLPSFMAKADNVSKTTALYQGAMDNYDAYSHIPCYCGCAIYTHPHHSLAECFIKEKTADGQITFTDHSLSCDICQGIAQMTVDGIAKQTPVKDIRTAVFSKFKYTQIWTDTPPVQ
jgi:hypothetical protein